MSYGDYDNYLELDNLGQCLITGEVTGDEKSAFDESGSSVIKKSNGAGKSTIPNVILWALFGRTMHSANPGDKVINWFTGKDCVAKLTFKNGDHIIRTRNAEGLNELSFIKDGEEFSSSVLSTSKNQQAELNKAFNLDWELLCGSMFFNQYSKPWMEMADQTRKKAIERVLHVDRFEYRSKVAKAKCDKLDSEVKKLRNKIEEYNRNKLRLANEITRITEARDRFDTNRQERVATIIDSANAALAKRDLIALPDLEKLQSKWDVIYKIKKKIEDMQTTANTSSTKIATIEGTISSIRQRIKAWKDKSGKSCGLCEQSVPATHTAAKIEPLQAELDKKLAEMAEERDILDSSLEKISSAKKLLTDKTPELTISNARDIYKQWEMYDNEYKRLLKSADRVAVETNPHEDTLAETIELSEKCDEDVKKAEGEIERVEYLNRHFNYIYKAWNDRTKIKSFVFHEHIPYINRRLKHYLDVFGLDIQVELTPALGITSNMWGYEFESGGERKRTDVAFMLAMFNFHEQMYGRQSNVLVLDEVDGRLDDDGIDSLINVIKNDLADKVETVMVISHRDMMHDTFPRELCIRRAGDGDFRGFSKIELI
jgi:DNA repair exonuclease SbcCD ATPase subunit